MRALVVTSSFPVRRQALGGRFVAELLRALEGHGWEFVVVTPDWEGETAPPDLGATRVVAARGAGPEGDRLAHGPGILEELSRRPWKWVLAPGLVLGLAAAARRLLERERFDLVWSHWLVPGGLSAVLATGGEGPPHLATAHGGDVHLLERWGAAPGFARVARHLWRRTALTAPVRHTAERLRALFGARPVEVIPLPAGEPVGEPRRHASGEPELLFLGRFEPVKGPDRLLDALRRLPSGTPFRLTLAGAGSLEPLLRSRARRWGARIRFAGVLDEDEKRLVLARARAVVFPSRRLAGGRGDGFPHAAMEALVQGTPLVASEHGALGAFVRRHRTGWVYGDSGSEERATRQLAASLARTLADGGETRAARRAARRAGRGFARAAAAAAWDLALRRAAGRAA